MVGISTKKNLEQNLKHLTVRHTVEIDRLIKKMNDNGTYNIPPKAYSLNYILLLQQFLTVIVTQREAFLVLRESNET